MSVNRFEMPEENVQDQAFVEYVVKAMVSHPEEVKTDRKVDEMGVLITLKVNPEDMGQIIGRSGQTARALRTLLRVVGAKNNARVNLKIDEPAGGRKPMSGSAPAADTSSAEQVDDLKI